MSASPPTRSNPYQGLIPFEEPDAPFFFGRDRETSRILSHVIASRLTLLYGPSGVGKSSVLNAGVAHRLWAMAAADIEDGIPPAHAVVSFGTWSGDPEPALIEAARRALEAIAQGPLPEPEGPGLAAALRAWTGPEGAEVSLIVLLDQFEELFVYHDGSPDTGGLGAELVDLLAPTGGAPRVHVLLSFREDALAQLDVFKTHLPGLFDTVLRIAPLTADAAAAAITGPAKRYNETAETPMVVEPALVGAVLHDVETGRIALASEGQGGVEARAGTSHVELPFLQLVLTRLWDRERELGSDALRLATYTDDLGGAEAIIRSHLDGALDALTPAQRDVAADVFRYLVTPSGTKYAIGSGDLARFAGYPEAPVQAVLDALSQSDRRVLRRIPPPQPGGEATYEVAHDRLGPAVLEWRARHVARQATERSMTQQRDRVKRLGGWAVGALVVMAFFSAVLWSMNREKSVRLDAAREYEERIRADSTALAQVVGAYREASLMTSPDGRYAVSLADRALHVFDTDNLTALTLPSDVPSGLTDVAFDSTGTRIALALRGGPIQVRSFPAFRNITAIPDPDVLVPMHEGTVRALAFSLTGDTLATGGADGTVRLWDARARAADTERTGRLHNVVQYPASIAALAPGGAECDGRPEAFCARGPSGDIMTRCTLAVEVVTNRRTRDGYRTAVRHALELEGRGWPSTMYKHHLEPQRLRTVVGSFCTEAEARRVEAAIRAESSDSPGAGRWADPAGWTRARVIDMSGGRRADACPAARFEGMASNRVEAGPAFECDPLDPR